MLPSNEALLTVFLSSLVGSLHCVGMCGGLLALCCLETSCGHVTTRTYSQLAYHLMRLLSYAILGAIAGSLGNFGNNLADAAGLQQSFGFFAGIILILWGCKELGFFARLGLSPNKKISNLTGFLSRKLFSLPLRATGVWRGAFIGLLSGLLPCGWLYAYVLAAAATKDPVGGSILMSVFWLGTVPILLVFAKALKKLNAKILKNVPRITAIFIVILGLITISGKLNIPVNINDGHSMESSCH